ncbi:MAG: hypothetical protein KDB03_28605 [Planctomycetales bacterium]|nr:hypothetical protein [Planctomycetales bacterium]
MPLSGAEKRQLRKDLIGCWSKMERETKQKFPGLAALIEERNPVVALGRLSSRETSGLARLFILGRQDLSVEQFILNSDWADRLDDQIIQQCRTNLG